MSIQQITNPFLFDKEVSGTHFCGRSNDINQLLNHIRNSVDVIMFAKKRLGKSSLIKEIFENHLDDDILRAHIDIYPVSSTKELYEKLKYGIAESLKGKESSLDKLQHKASDLQKYFARAKISLQLTPMPVFEIEPTSSLYHEAIMDILTGYFDYLEDNKLFSIIAIDEFQKIASLSENAKIEEVLRTAISKRKNCSFIFIGSERNKLLSMFNSPNRPFYKLGIEHSLGPIEQEVFYKWILKNFKKENIILEEDAFNYLYSESYGETRFIQWISYKMFELENGMTIIDKVKMRKYIDETILNDTGTAMYYNTFPIVQQNILKIIAKEDGSDLYSKYVLDKYDIKKGSLQSGIERLVNAGEIFKSGDKYIFENIELGMWLKLV
ncbi:hypothetical protein MN086_10610 [Sulfurovum sp. XGS-02]|uniref:ATP-binding protein n=1 Tax=Sulfurovum sp. XGS-02 TaxID=2925411 RepID=UPI0020609E83|nr:ATP-binding protein [Sulfurovum sp. XGS-02]UPT77485.1 hypothetical protein MN086_10610 [Sulfurovum sp. XGS-02]